MSCLVATGTACNLFDIRDLQGYEICAITLDSRVEDDTLDGTATISFFSAMLDPLYLQIEAHADGIASYEKIVLIVWVVE